MKHYRIIQDVSKNNRLMAILDIHRPALGVYGRELGVVQAQDHAQALDLAFRGEYLQPEELGQEPW